MAQIKVKDKNNKWGGQKQPTAHPQLFIRSKGCNKKKST